MSSIPSRFRKSLQACGGLTGIATVAMGLVVIFGWHLGNRTLIQVLPQFVPIQYNTALGFVFSGLSLVEYVGDVSLGIDQVFMDDITTMTYASRDRALVTAFAMTCPTRSGTP